MKKQFINLLGNAFDVEFTEHNIDSYEVLFHVTNKTVKEAIVKEGLKIGKPLNKSLIDTKLLFFSYPIDMNTSDCFRWNDKYCSLIILDAKKLKQDGFKFYDDYFGILDQSSKRNHICTDVDIPHEYVSKVVEF